MYHFNTFIVLQCVNKEIIHIYFIYIRKIQKTTQDNFSSIGGWGGA